LNSNVSSKTNSRIVWKRRTPKTIFARGIGRAILPDEKWRKRVWMQQIVRRLREAIVTIFDKIREQSSIFSV
jgi:hypothetical protein